MIAIIIILFLVVLIFVLIIFYLIKCKKCEEDNDCCGESFLERLCDINCEVDTTEVDTTTETPVICPGYWDISACRSNGIDVVCGESQRTYTFTNPQNIENTNECLEKYISEIPEYLRGQINNIVVENTTVTEDCTNTSSDISGESLYTSKQCQDCLINHYVSENRKCNPCDISEKTLVIKNPNDVNHPDGCVPKKCIDWYDDSGGDPDNIERLEEKCGGDTLKFNWNERSDIGYGAETCCISKTCSDWYQDLSEGDNNPCGGNDELIKLDDSKSYEGGYSKDYCCVPKTCGEWYSENYDETHEIDGVQYNPCESFDSGLIYKEELESISGGRIIESCCISKTCDDWYNENYDETEGRDPCFIGSSGVFLPDKKYDIDKSGDFLYNNNGSDFCCKSKTCGDWYQDYTSGWIAGLTGQNQEDFSQPCYFFPYNQDMDDVEGYGENQCCEQITCNYYRDLLECKDSDGSDGSEITHIYNELEDQTVINSNSYDYYGTCCRPIICSDIGMDNCENKTCSDWKTVLEGDEDVYVGEQYISQKDEFFKSYLSSGDNNIVNDLSHYYSECLRDGMTCDAYRNSIVDMYGSYPESCARFSWDNGGIETFNENKRDIYINRWEDFELCCTPDLPQQSTNDQYKLAIPGTSCDDVCGESNLQCDPGHDIKSENAFRSAMDIASPGWDDNVLCSVGGGTSYIGESTHAASFGPWVNFPGYDTNGCMFPPSDSVIDPTDYCSEDAISGKTKICKCIS